MCMTIMKWEWEPYGRLNCASICEPNIKSTDVNHPHISQNSVISALGSTIYTLSYLRRPTCLPQPVYWALVVQGAQDHEVKSVSSTHLYRCIFSCFLLYFSVNFSPIYFLILLFQKVPALEVHLLSPERKWALSYKWVVVKALGGLPCTFWVIRQPPTSTI